MRPRSNSRGVRRTKREGDASKYRSFACRGPPYDAQTTVESDALCPQSCITPGRAPPTCDAPTHPATDQAGLAAGVHRCDAADQGHDLGDERPRHRANPRSRCKGKQLCSLGLGTVELPTSALSLFRALFIQRRTGWAHAPCQLVRMPPSELRPSAALTLREPVATWRNDRQANANRNNIANVLQSPEGRRALGLALKGWHPGKMAGDLNRSQSMAAQHPCAATALGQE